MSKTRNLSKVLALVIMLALVIGILPMGAMATDPLTTTDAVDGLTISVDYATEKIYLQKNSSTSYTLVRRGGFHILSLQLFSHHEQPEPSEGRHHDQP